MNLKLQTVQPEFLAKLLQDVEAFKGNVDDFVNDYTDKLVFYYQQQLSHEIVLKLFSWTLAS